MAFLFGGLVTTAGRLARSSIRPLVLPAPGAPPSLAKHVYDILGTLTTVLLVNYAALPFMQLTIDASIQSWRNLGWYGNWIIGTGLLFFYAGGSAFLKGLHKANVGSSEKANGMANGSSKGTSVSAVEGAGAYPPSFDQIIPPRQ
jgi:lysophospholipid acyltransferase